MNKRHDVAASVAENLAGEPILTIDVLPHAGNNRMYRVRTLSGSYALKAYIDGRTGAGRLRAEYDALSFLAATGAARYVPRALAVDRESGFALYEWIDGRPLTTHGDRDIDAALRFIGQAHAASMNPQARKLAAAAEACFSAHELLTQLAGRTDRLRNAVAGHCAATAFLANDLEPRIHAFGEAVRRSAHQARIGIECEIDMAARTLSPSDFSFHNALRRSDASVVFFDFEYFGWDDPVKLVADFLWHPAMQISIEEAARFARGAQSLFAPDDPDYMRRLRAYFPMFGLKWCLIILNVFLADDWSRRQFSGDERSRDSAKNAQLQKARTLLHDVVAGTREEVLW